MGGWVSKGPRESEAMEVFWMNFVLSKNGVPLPDAETVASRTTATSTPLSTPHSSPQPYMIPRPSNPPPVSISVPRIPIRRRCSIDHWDDEEEHLQRLYDQRTWSMYLRITQARQLAAPVSLPPQQRQRDDSSELLLVSPYDQHDLVFPFEQ